MAEEGERAVACGKVCEEEVGEGCCGGVRGDVLACEGVVSGV